MKTRTLVITLAAFLGMIDTLYLSMKRNAGPIPCHVTRGCGDVLTSSYSEVAGIPLSWIGFFFYIAVFSCAVFEMSGSRGALRWIFWPALGAFGLSIVLVGIQAFVLRAFCEYCLLSAGLVTTIFLLLPRASEKTQSGKFYAAGLKETKDRAGGQIKRTNPIR